MQVLKFLCLFQSIIRFQARAEAVAGLYFLNNCSNVQLVYKNAYLEDPGYVALRFEVRTIKKDDKLDAFKDISFVERRSLNTTAVFFTLQFRIGSAKESLKMNYFHVQNDSFQCNNESYPLEMILTTEKAHFKSAVRNTDFCEKYELRKIEAILKIFAFDSQKKHILLAGNRSFDIEETAFGLLNIEVSTGVDDDVLKTAEEYRKNKCPLEKNSVGVIGYLIVAVFVITVLVYSFYQVFHAFHNRIRSVAVRPQM